MYILYAVMFMTTFHIYCASQVVSYRSCDKTLADGIEAYLDERWDDCVENLEEVIKIFKTYQSVVSGCRLKCNYNEGFIPFFQYNIDDLQFYEKILHRTLCLMDCQKERFINANVSNFLSPKTISSMKSLTPYDYLHICYFKNGLSQKAASAAFTYLSKNPEHKAMRSNLQYYLNMADVTKHDITNYEAEEYFTLYMHGMKYYEEMNWEEVVMHMESAISAYIYAEESCRATCEGPFDQGWYPDFTTSISNHFTFCLKCKLKCSEELKPPNGLAGKELLADIYNYLQYSYFKLGRIKEAIRAVASYLLVHHFDDDMLQNKQYYLSLAVSDKFDPRPEIIQYVYRQDYEEKILNFVNKEFYSRLETNEV